MVMVTEGVIWKGSLQCWVFWDLVLNWIRVSETAENLTAQEKSCRVMHESLWEWEQKKEEGEIKNAYRAETREEIRKVMLMRLDPSEATQALLGAHVDINLRAYLSRWATWNPCSLSHHFLHPQTLTGAQRMRLRLRSTWLHCAN